MNRHPPQVSSDPDLLKQRSSYGVGVRSAFVKFWYPFVISAMFNGYSNPSLVHLRLKHRGNVFFFRLGWKKRLLSKGDVVFRLR